MQNKGFVTTFAIALSFVCLFYLSFTVVTKIYDNKAEQYAMDYASKNANGDNELYDKLYQESNHHYLDSMSTERVFLNMDFLGWDKMKGMGYTLKACRERELGLGLDLKGGMSVIVEVDVAGVLRSLGDIDNQAFIDALKEASVENSHGSGRDYITIFVEKFKAKSGDDKLAGIFSTKLKDQIQATDKDDKVISVLRSELNSAADNSFNILRTRIDRFGVVAPNIQKLNNRAERIMIELPGIKEPERVRKLLQGSANLEFWRTYNANSNEVQSAIYQLNDRSMNALATINGTESGTEKDSLIANLGFSKSLNEYLSSGMGGASIAMVSKKDTAAVGNIIRKFKDAHAADLRFAWGFKAEDPKETYFSLYTLRANDARKGPALDGDVVTNAKADQAHNSATWEVSMQMNSVGAQRWALITGAEVGNAIAIVVDGHVYSAPNVNAKIEGGRSSITGRFSYEDASDLENVLKSGRMKAGVRIIQEDVVGPSLGQEAINAGMISFVLAIVILMAYMCVAYGVIPGLIANAALIINLFFTMGTLSAFGAVLTLPGITGLVLTLAMAVDANVLIYERTKEELRAGKNTKTALADGYKHAFSAIFDANVTSIITGVILMVFGTGAVQGFATTLIIGIVASFITAVFLTRIFYEFMLDKGYFRKLSFSTPISKNLFVDSKINFLKKTKGFTIILAVIILGGIISLFVNGLSSGIDFTGGRNYLVRFEKPASAGDVERALIPEFEDSKVHVITSGAGSQAISSSQLRITTNYKVEDSGEQAEKEVRAKLTNALLKMENSPIDAGSTIDNYIQSTQLVGPSIADDLARSSTIAVLVAIVCMALYILIRFRDMAFSVGTLVAVALDALIVILLYSILYKIMPFSMEIDQAFIAAILTVVGYSINDKVVIFDRIRELRHTYPKRDLTEVINLSLNQTLGRTVNTGMSAILVVLCIFLLGGETIRSFTFAILLGVVIGTFSSLFIATPIAWKMLIKKLNKEIK